MESGSVVFGWVLSGEFWDGRVYFDSLGVTHVRLQVARFIGEPLGSLRQAQWTLGSFEFAWVHTSACVGRRVHSRVHLCSRGNT